MWKVYQIKTLDGKIYIGCTSMAIDKRLAVHRYRKKEFVLQKYEVTIFLSTEVYEEASQLECKLIKQFDSTNQLKGYNRRFGDSRSGFPKYVKENWSKKVKELHIFEGERNPNWGKKHSVETREKMRQKALARHPSTFDKNRIKTPEQLEKLQQGRQIYVQKNGHPMKGRTHSLEARKKISLANSGHQRWLGKTHSEETKKKISDSKKKALL